jgi:hypothetical protein
MTQCDRLLNSLLRGHKITPLHSWRDLGIYRLASRISELRLGQHDGICYPIKKEMVKVANQFGDSATVARYYISADDFTDIKIAQLRAKEKANEQEQRRSHHS